MTLQLHRPHPERGIEAGPPDPNWRQRLRSPRWNVPALVNPDMNPTRTGRAVAFWLVLALVTFVLLLAGYGSGFWR